MSVPYFNTTCDIYRVGNAPPASPDVASVKCAIEPKGQSTLTTPYYTHVLRVPASTDIRDDLQANSLLAGANCDKVYIPDKNGIWYKVVLVRTRGLRTALVHKEVLLYRAPGANVTWGSGGTPGPIA